MAKQTVVVKKDEAERIEALGCQVAFLCPAEKTERSFSLIEVTAPKKGGPPPHHHPWDEAYYILSGEARFQVGEKTVDVKAGDFLYAPANTVHAFQGLSDEPARMLIFDAPAAAEGFFRDVNREVRELPKDLPKVPEIGRRHKLVFLK